MAASEIRTRNLLIRTRPADQEIEVALAAGLYPANGSIRDPVTVEDPMTASPYHHPHSPSGDEAQVRQQTSNYYGMIAQNDGMVGDLLGKLETLGLTASTLVIYVPPARVELAISCACCLLTRRLTLCISLQVADHGEMLGDHHMQSKMVFYEGSVHIPLIMRLPGVIPAGKVVDAPVSNMALFGTIADFVGLSGQSPSTSESLRPLIDGTDRAAERIVFSFWNSDVSPGYMAFDGRFKLMIGRKRKTDDVALSVDEQGFDAPGVDALFDLQCAVE